MATDQGTYVNPILAGDHPDPTILRVSDDYFMTHSTSYVPSLLIWHSRDLVHWRPVCHALTKRGSGCAPDLAQHGDLFYIYFCGGGTNWVVTAPSPRGPWTEPVDVGVGHIDPGHVADREGNRFLHLSDGHLVRLSEDGLRAVGDVRKVYDGWQIPPEWPIEGFCLESPKITIKDGYYYLMSAEGGTAGPPTSHMVIAARSRSPDGPWENSPHNPVIHTASRSDKWWSCGHGTLVQGPSGQWHCVYHAYENGYRTLGRQTLLEPIDWTPDGWPVARKGVDRAGPLAAPGGHRAGNGPVLSDDFEGPRLGLQWSFWREHDPGRYRTGDGALSLKAHGTSSVDTSPVTCIPTDHAYEVEVDVELTGGCEAGLVLFYNHRAHAGLSFREGGVTILRYGRRQDTYDLRGTRATLKLFNDRHDLDVFLRPHGQEWKKLTESIDVSGYHHNALGRFAGLRVGLYACGSGTAIFRRFRYRAVTER